MACRAMCPVDFLSLSQIIFEIGDKPEIESVYGDIVSPDALWSYLISEKQREVLTPNLPLSFRVFAADGYDGGLLPMASLHCIFPFAYRGRHAGWTFAGKPGLYTRKKVAAIDGCTLYYY